LILQVQEQWTYLNATDCPFRVLRVIGDPGKPAKLALDDGRVVDLEPATLGEQESRGLRCEVPSRGLGRPLTARFTNRAAMDLSAWLEIDEDGRAEYLDGTKRVPVARLP
jgi:hypothetical protein